MKEFKPGRELDELVAEKVMGWHRSNVDYAHLSWNTTEGFRSWEPTSFGSFQPSTNIASTLEVIEKMREHPEPRFRSLRLVAYSYNRAYATFDSHQEDGDGWLEANGPLGIQLAVCLAALHAVGVLE